MGKEGRSSRVGMRLKRKRKAVQEEEEGEGRRVKKRKKAGWEREGGSRRGGGMHGNKCPLRLGCHEVPYAKQYRA